MLRDLVETALLAGDSYERVQKTVYPAFRSANQTVFLTQNSDLDPLRDVLDPATNSLAYLYFLSARLKAGKGRDDSYFLSLSHAFSSKFSNQVWIAPGKVKAFAQSVCSIAERYRVLTFEKLRRAVEFFEICITVPATHTSWIQIEAYRKCVLTNFIATGKSYTMPKFTSPTTSRMLQTNCGAYQELAKALESELLKSTELLGKSGNLGLARQSYGLATPTLNDGVTRNTQVESAVLSLFKRKSHDSKIISKEDYSLQISKEFIGKVLLMDGRGDRLNSLPSGSGQWMGAEKDEV
ncbi:hypothetical protein BC829DRAFT_401071 [Chytridium lagenaria]|nr:hypothetical protein BC829DRAFT_401071 [Chytridium lagenaria]